MVFLKSDKSDTRSDIKVHCIVTFNILFYITEFTYFL